MYLWSANVSGSVSKVDFNSGNSFNFTMGFSQPDGIIFDGANLWVTDLGDNTLKRLDSNGTVIQTVPVGGAPRFPVFDGSNVWVPNSNDASVTVVRARDGIVLATLTGNGLNGPVQAAFDGERILVTNFGGNSLSLWKATDLTPVGNVFTGTGTGPWGVCSDGINFWITLEAINELARL
jgi:YVTN family beta-propeller protein